MKVSPSVLNHVTGPSKFLKAPIQFYARKNTDSPSPSTSNASEHSSNATVHEVRYDSNNADSSTYKLYIDPFDTGTPEEWLEFIRKLNLVVTGNGLLTTPMAAYNLTRSVLRGNALDVFDNKARQLQTINVENYIKCLNAVTNDIFPRHALQNQKRYMRNVTMRSDTTVDAFFNRWHHINDMLALFPPHQGNSQKFGNDEIIEIIYGSIPFAWKGDLQRLNDFDINETDMQSFRNALTRLELSYQMDSAAPTRRHDEPQSSSRSNRTKRGRRNDSTTSQPPAKKPCRYHGYDSHTTEDCKKIQQLIDAEKNSNRSQPSREHPQQRRRNQSQGQGPSRNEIHTMVSETIQDEFLPKMESMFQTMLENHAKRERDASDDQVEQDDEQFDLESVSSLVDDELNEAVVSHEIMALSALRAPPRKRQKTNHLTPVTVGLLNGRLGKVKSLSKCRILLDSGSSGSIVVEKFVQKLRMKHDSTTTWETKGGTFHTTKRCKTSFVLPEFFRNKAVEWEFHVDSTPGPHKYDMIIGRDLMSELGITLNFGDSTMTWDESTISMKEPESLPDLLSPVNDFYWYEDLGETEALREASARLKNILDAKYKPADLDEVVRQCEHLDRDQQQQLYALLSKYESLFDGTLGTWHDQPYNIELQEGAKPYHARPFPIPKVHEHTLKVELDRLVKIGVLKRKNNSEWAAPTFIIPKKDGTVRFISDFRELNKRIKRKPFPIPKIQDLLLKLEGFQYCTSLDLNMGYYHIELTPFSKSLCTIVTPFGKYEYQRLPMGLCNSPDIFQERMYELFSDLEYVRAYIDDLLITSSSTFEDHLERLDKVFARLSEAGLKVNATKSHFAQTETEYLGYKITRDGIQPLSKKVQAMEAIAPPTNLKQLRRFLGLINYYRDMWIRRSEILAPLTRLTSSKVKWQWTDVEQTAFDTIKRIIGREVLLSYPDFTKPFEIHTDASHTQLGAVISQDNKPIAFYSRKLNPAQTRYTTTERELLSIVETLKEFKNILLGQEIVVFTDHKNLTAKHFNTERVMRWRLLIEEFGPTMKYIQGPKNIVADALSRLELVSSAPTIPSVQDTASDLALVQLAESYGLDKDDLPSTAFPVSYRLIHQEQQKDKTLLGLVQTGQHYSLKDFYGGGRIIRLLCYKDRIAIPKTLQNRIVQWYHTTLCHPGINRTEETISQHFYWKNMRDQITRDVTTCAICQKQKRQRRKYGLLPEKEAEFKPWERLCVDLIGPYKIKSKRGGRSLPELKCVTMIDPATGWFEIKQYDDKKSITVANIVEQEWLARYPKPSLITLDRGSEFIGEDFRDMVENDYGIKRKVISTRNPQANAIVERAHQTLGNLIRSMELQDNPYFDPDDPWSGILAAASFAMRATYHTTLQATPGQLVFGRDMILNTQYLADWTAIKTRKQDLIRKNNLIENAKRIPHRYQVGDQVMLEHHRANKYEQPYKGPFTITKVNNNGTVRLRMGAVTDTVNIRRIHPFRTTSHSRRR
jgi:hypothetical protein